MGLIDNEILDHGHMVERINPHRPTDFADRLDACEIVAAVDVHRAGAADAFATRAPEGQGRVDLVLDLDQRIENHGTAGVEINLEAVKARSGGSVRVIPVYL